CFQSLAAVLNSVDGFLRLLDANAHLERFWCHGNAAAAEHFISVASAVANRQHDNIGRDIPGRSRDALEKAVIDVEVFHTTAEANLSAECLNFTPNRLHYSRQTIAAEVRPIFIKNGRFALAFREKLEHAANIRPGAAAGKLTVAECAGPAFAEQIVALGIERTAGVESTNVVDPIPHRLAALQHQWAVTALCQEIGCHQTSRPRADDDRP